MYQQIVRKGSIDVEKPIQYEYVIVLVFFHPLFDKTRAHFSGACSLVAEQNQSEKITVSPACYISASVRYSILYSI